MELLTTEPGPGSQGSEDGLEIRSFHRNWPGAVCPSAGLARYCGAVAADVVHHHSLWLRTLHYAHRAARRASAPLVVSPRGMMDPWAWRHHSRRKAFAQGCHPPRGLEAVDGWHATSREEAGRAAQPRVSAAGMRGPERSLRPVGRGGGRGGGPLARSRAGVATRPVALFYSRFHQKKRLLELIDTWLEAGPADWLLLVVGIPGGLHARGDRGVRAAVRPRGSGPRL